MKKRIISTIILVCFMFTVFNTFATSAQENPNLIIDGPSYILKPMNDGYTKVRYTLKDENGNKCSAVWTSNDTNLLSCDGYMVLTKESDCGAFTICADYNGNIYSKSVTVGDGFCEDFQSGVIGQDYYNYKNGSRVAKYATDDNEQIYLNPVVSVWNVLPGSNAISANENYIFECDIRCSDVSYKAPAVGIVTNSNNTWSGGLTFKVSAEGKYIVKTEDYTNYDSETNPVFEIREAVTNSAGGEWAHVKLVSQYNGVNKDNTYDIYVDDMLCFDDITLKPIGFLDTNGNVCVNDCTGIKCIYGYSPIDNIAIYSGNRFNAEDEPYLGFNIQGKTTVVKPFDDNSVYEDYNAFNYFKDEIMPIWTVSPENKGASIDESGILCITDAAEFDNYEIKAEIDGYIEVKSIHVLRDAYQLKINGVDSINLFGKDTVSAQYEACIVNSSDNTVAKALDKTQVQWSISPIAEGVSIADGMLTINSSCSGEYTVGAKYGEYYSELNVNAKVLEIAISGPSEILKPSENKMSAIEYRLADSSGNNYTDVQWTSEDVEISEEGRITVSNKTDDTIVIHAQYEGVEYSKEISVKEGSFYDFESFSLNDTYPSGSTGFIKNDTQGNIGNYCCIEKAASNTAIPLAFCNDNFYLSLDFLIKEGETVSPFLIMLDSKNGYISQPYIKCVKAGDSYNVTLGTTDYVGETSKSLAKTIEFAKENWHNLKFDFNIADNCYSLYLDNSIVFNNVHLRNSDLTSIRFAGSIDNIATYSGNVFDRQVTYMGPRDVSVSKSGSSVTILSANVTDNGINNPNVKLKWELSGFGDDFVGDKNNVFVAGNKLYTNDFAYGTVYLCATDSLGTANTGNIAITLNEGFTLLDDNTLTAYGNVGESISIKQYSPSSGDFFDAVSTFDEDVFESFTDVFDENGMARVNLNLNKVGMYYLVVTNNAGSSDTYVIVNGGDTLLKQPDACDLLLSDKVYDYLDEYTSAETALVNKCIAEYKSLSATQKEKAVKLCKEQIDNLYACVLLVSYLNGNDGIENDLKKCLEDREYDTAAIDLIANHKQFSEIAEISLTNENIADIMQCLKEQSVLKGIANSGDYYLSAHIFLKALNSEKYNFASDYGKDLIAKAVSGNVYDTMQELLNAINAVDVTANKQTTSGSKGGGGKAGVSAGFVPNFEVIEKTTDKIGFSDIDDTMWAKEYISKLADREIIAGYEDGSFCPSNFVSRAEFAKMISLAFDVSSNASASFDDVNETDWFAPYVNACFNNHIVYGNEGYFRPNDCITRQEAAVILYRIACYASIRLNEKDYSFIDSEKIAAYAQSALKYLTDAGIICGNEKNEFNPLSYTSRAEAAKMICQLLMYGGLI